MSMQYTIFLIVILIGAAGCNLPSAKVKNTLGDKADVKNGKRSKLVIQKEKKNTETGVYMHDLELREPLMVDGKTVPGKRRFEIGINGGYVGEKRACEPVRYALIILHEKPVKTGWQYPSMVGTGALVILTVTVGAICAYRLGNARRIRR